MSMTAKEADRLISALGVTLIRLTRSIDEHGVTALLDLDHVLNCPANAG
jgi:hypothetical protein